MPSIFIKTSQKFFVGSCWISAFTQKIFGKLRVLEVCPRRRCKRSSILAIKICLQRLTNKRKRRFAKSFTKNNQEILMKIEEMADVFLNSTNFDFSATQQLCFEPKGVDIMCKTFAKHVNSFKFIVKIWPVKKIKTLEIITPHCDDAFRSPVTILFCLSLSSVLVLFDLRAQDLTLLGMQCTLHQGRSVFKAFLKLRRIK